jgi:hypothetical protein
MSGFLVVLIVVAVVALALAAFFRTRNVASDLGESPQSFAHPEDQPVSEQPSDDARDAPLPKRPVRSRG